MAVRIALVLFAVFLGAGDAFAQARAGAGAPQAVGAAQAAPRRAVENAVETTGIKAGYVDSAALHPDGRTPMLSLVGLPVLLAYPQARPAGDGPLSREEAKRLMDSIVRTFVGKSVVVVMSRRGRTWTADAVRVTPADAPEFTRHAIRHLNGDVVTLSGRRGSAANALVQKSAPLPPARRNER